MKKRLLCTILIMVMMFGATVPSYADPWTSEQAYQTTQGVRSLVSLVTSIYQLLQTTYGSSGDLALMGENIAKLVSWFAPEGYMPSDYHTLWELVIDIGTNLNTYLPHIPTIASYVGSWMTTNNSYLNKLKNAMSNITGSYAYHQPIPPATIVENGHYSLFDVDPEITTSSKRDGRYGLFRPTSTGGMTTQYFMWQQGSPLGNIALLLKENMNANTLAYTYKWNATLTDYNAQLGIWDSQGETLTQEGWSPTSAINGLYKYLAYTQRDVARLTYVLASDEEITAREKARDNQEAVLDNFVDPEGNGSVSASNFGDIASASDNFKDNMNTGVSASGIFDVFTGDHTSRWFSTEMANSINNVGSGSRSLKAATPLPTYETPLLDAKMTELLGIFGGDD